VFDSFVDTNTIDVEALSRAARMSAHPIPVPPPAGCDEEQVSEVALVEVGGPYGEEAHDRPLAVG